MTFTAVDSKTQYTTESPQAPRSPTAELWGDEPDELLFYDEIEGEDQEYADNESHHGENNQQALYDEADQYSPEDGNADEAYLEADADADADGDLDVDYENPEALEESAALQVTRTESPVTVTKPTSTIRSWSSLSSKRSFDDSENLDQKGESVTL